MPLRWLQCGSHSSVATLTAHARELFPGGDAGALRRFVLGGTYDGGRGDVKLGRGWWGGRGTEASPVACRLLLFNSRRPSHACAPPDSSRPLPFRRCSAPSCNAAS